jgi:CBS-domain-containing membrane protein
MQEAVGIRREETVKDAFKRMHEHHLSGLPVLDESDFVTGYISLMSLLSVFLSGKETSPNAQGEQDQ